MKQYTMKRLMLAILVIVALTVPTFAMEQGAYGVYCGTNYYNPDTGEIDDGGTANAALGEGMCRSATASSALVEKDGDQYYVTIRLLLQSNTNTTLFWRHTGYNTYEEVDYTIVAENAVDDSIDYRFAVDDPFDPIRASMYVIPMGRATLWYIELDESSLTTDTGDFEVSVSSVVVETPEVEVTEEEVPAVEEEIVEEEIVEEEIVEEVLQEEVQEPEVETPEVEVEEPEVEVETPEADVEEPEAETLEEEEEVETEQAPVAEETQTEEQSGSSWALYAVLIAIVAVVAVVFVKKKGKKA